MCRKDFGKNPTVVTATFGMNDSGYFEYNGDNPTAYIPLLELLLLGESSSQDTHDSNE